jgi:hypothetical protein
VKGSGGADSLYGQDGNDAVNSRDGVSGNDTLRAAFKTRVAAPWLAPPAYTPSLRP